MESEKKEIDPDLLAEIEAFELKRMKKKKRKGWRSSKLDPVSYVLVELRRQGRSLQFMADFVFDKFRIKVHKSTVSRQLKKLELQKMERNYAEQK